MNNNEAYDECRNYSQTIHCDSYTKNWKWKKIVKMGK